MPIIFLGIMEKIYPEEQKYYVKTYDRGVYIGRVLKVRKTSVEIKFSEKRKSNQYDSPKHMDICLNSSSFIQISSKFNNNYNDVHLP